MLASLARVFSIRTTVGPAYIRPSVFLVFLVTASLILVSGLRNNIGDTFFYMHGYSVNDFSLQNISLAGDFGFTMLQALLHQISSDPQILIFVTALITNALIMTVLFKYCRMIELAVFFYITSGLYIVSMNGIRQFLAASILFAATKFVLNGDWKKYIAVVLFASMFHKSALILLPIYFVVRREAWTKMTMLLIACAILIAVGFSSFSSVLFAVIENSHYGVYQNFNEGGANILRVLVNAVPIVIAFLGRHKLRELWPQSDYIVNFALLSNVFLVIATQNWIFARFNIYFGLYNIILISWIVKLFVESNRSLIYYGMIICYAIYFYYEQFISLGLIYESDYLSF